MIKLISQSGRAAYGVCEYLIDFENELQQIPNWCSIGSTVIVVETGKKYIKTSVGEWIIDPESVGGSGGNGSVQANWAENNEEASGYIKNRTHYVSSGKSLIYQGRVRGASALEYYIYQIPRSLMESTFTIDQLQENKKVYVSYTTDQNNEYIDIFNDKISYYSLENTDYYFVGNKQLIIDFCELALNAEDYTNANETIGICFLITTNDTETTFKLIIMANKTSYDPLVTFKIELEGGEVVYQLDEKFIPDTIARKSDITNAGNSVQSDFNQNDETQADYIKNRPFYEVPSETTTVVDYTFTEGELAAEDMGNGTYLYTKSFDNAPEVMSEALVVGETYNIIIDGVVYTLNAIENYRYVNLEAKAQYNYAFSISTQGTDVFSVTFSGIESPKTVKIERVGAQGSIVQIDEKFIPDTIARANEVSEMIKTQLSTEKTNIIKEATDLAAEDATLKAIAVLTQL